MGTVNCLPNGHVVHEAQIAAIAPVDLLLEDFSVTHRIAMHIQPSWLASLLIWMGCNRGSMISHKILRLTNFDASDDVKPCHSMAQYVIQP